MEYTMIALASVAVGWILFYLVTVFDPIAENFATFMRVLVPVLGVIFFLYLLSITGIPL